MTKRLLTLMWTAMTLAVPTLPTLAAEPEDLVRLSAQSGVLPQETPRR